MFRENIRKYYDHLSRSYRKVADFILNDYRTAAFMTAAALADAVEVDTTTVVRFAQRLGYPGYPELIEDIQQQIKTELNQNYAVIPVVDTPQTRVQQRVAQDRSNLDKALAHNTPAAIATILGLLRAAPRIVVIGESYAAPLAESFAVMLREGGLPATYVIGDVYERANALAHVARKELVIGLTPLGGPTGVARALRFAREGGAATLAVTPTLSSQAARAAEHLLYAPGEAEGTLSGLTGLYSMLTALAQEIAAPQAETIAKRAKAVAHALEELA